MTPYYQDDAVTIYHGDCREILPSLSADVLVTDPPYGVEMGVSNDKRGWPYNLAKTGYGDYQDTYENFCDLVPPVIRGCLEIVKRGAVFTGPHVWDLPKADAIGGIYCPSALGRTSWGFKSLLPILLYGVQPDLQAGRGARATVLSSSIPAERESGHPCPKPMAWLTWLVSLASLAGETVFDPFMGSGTTLRAAKDLGRKAIGIEIEERYCEIAAMRCAQEVLDFGAVA